MSFVTYYPDQRHLLPLTAIRRERTLPPDAIGQVEAQPGERIDLRDVVARGSIPSRYAILEAVKALNLRRPDELESKMLVEMGEMVNAGQVLAGKANKRGRHIASPVNGIIAYVGDGRIIVQEIPEPITIESGLIGQVVGLQEGRGVVIETIGAVLQGAWGNGRFGIGQLRIEPADGLETIYGDQLDIAYRGAVVVTRRPLVDVSLLVVADQEFAGVIAPSMDASLIDQARETPAAIVLTQGFGSTSRMSQYIISFLEGLAGRQATIDAVLPDRFDPRRPEVIINVGAPRGERPTVPSPHLLLTLGMNVRITRGDYAGVVGRVGDLPKTPHLLDNGLRVFCARVDMPTGNSAYIPLANLEIFGS